MKRKKQELQKLKLTKLAKNNEFRRAVTAILILSILAVLNLSVNLNRSTNFQSESQPQEQVQQSQQDNFIEELKLTSEDQIISQEDAQADEEKEVLGTQDSTVWTANNYEQGDITGNTYTVKRGDTLWEIAEGRYGNGGQWHKIFNANSIEKLPNGNPLIIPGQVLILPD